MNEEIALWLAEWSEVRGKTLEFLEGLQNEQFAWRPAPQLGTFGMQIRHLAKVQEAYVIGMKTGRVVFGDRNFDPEVETDKQKALAYVEKVDADLLAMLEAWQDPGVEIVILDNTGEKKLSLLTVLQYVLHHELYHQGIFTCYARLAGIEPIPFRP